MALQAWALLLEDSAAGEWMRNSSVAYPALNLVHLLGLMLLLGPMLLLDLRLLGAGRRFALPDVSQTLTPWAIAGLVLLLASGFMLFSADASALLVNPLFPIKLGLIALGILNALAFRWLWPNRLGGWDHRPPWGGRAQAAVSILLWIAAATLGRLLAYV